MRTYTRIVLSIIVSAIMLSLFTGSSCDNGTGSKKNGSVVGTWLLTSVKMLDTLVGDLDLTAENFLTMSGTGATTSTMQFNEDGTASLTTTYEAADDEVITGSWTAEGDDLTIVGAGMDDTFTYKADGSTLTLTRVMPIDFDSNGTDEDITVKMIYSKV